MIVFIKKSLCGAVVSRLDQMSFYGIGEEIYLSRLIREYKDNLFIY